MTLEERVINKLQDIIGDKYELNLGVAFDRRYTMPVATASGTAFDINYQAFDEKKDKIICVFTMQPTDYNVVPFLNYNTSYTLQLWYALDNLKTDKFGVPIGDLPVDIYADLKSLRTALSNTTIDFGGSIKGKMTFSEPAKSTTYDNTGTGKRGVLTVSGKINLSDDAIFGSERIIKIGVTTGEKTTYYTMPKRSYSISNDRDGTSTHPVGAVRPSVDGQVNGNSIMFTYDNYTDTTNKAMELIEKIACGVATVDTNYTVPVQIYKGSTEIISFNALISAVIQNQNGDTGTEIIQVTLQRS